MKELKIIVTVDAKTGELKAVQEELNKVASSSKNADKSVRTFSSGVKSGSVAIKGFIASFAGIAATTGIFLRLADSYKIIDGRLKLVSASSNELIASQQALMNIANETRQSYELTADLYSRIARSTQDLGVSQGQTAEVTKIIAQSLNVSGANAQASAAALMQLGQAFASGTLRGEELNSVLEQAPRLAQAIADGLGVTVGALRGLAAEGKLTSEEVFNAIKSQAGAMQADFEQMPLTIGGALTQLQNAFMELSGHMDEASDATGTASGSISTLANLISENKHKIVDFGGDVYKSFELMGLGVILLVNGAQEGFYSIATLVVKYMGGAVNTVIGFLNKMIDAFENAINAVNSFVGANEIAFGRIGEVTFEATFERYQASVEKTNLTMEAIKQTIADIAKEPLPPKKIELSTEVNEAKLKTAANKVAKATGKNGKTAQQLADEAKRAIQAELGHAIAYYDAIGDLSNKRIKEREKETIRLKELGLNNLQIQEYFAKQEAKFTQDKTLEKLRYEERYYELLGDKVRASNARLRAQAIEMEQGGASKEDIAKGLYGEENRKQNYTNLGSAMGFDGGIVGQFQAKMDAIDTFHAMEYERIERHYAAIGDVQGGALAKQNELDRLAMQTRMASAGAGFDGLAGLAKAFYDASGGQNKTALRAYQAMMVGKAIVNTYTAATNAYASAGNPVLGAVMAAVAIAQGMAQVAMIKAQKFHTGGYVSGASDEVPAVLQRGEGVLSRKGMRNLDALNSDGGMASGGSEPSITIVNTLNPQAFEQWANSRGGRRVIKNVIGGN